jgi:hypothetical protein
MERMNELTGNVDLGYVCVVISGFDDAHGNIGILRKPSEDRSAFSMVRFID